MKKFKGRDFGGNMRKMPKEEKVGFLENVVEIKISKQLINKSNLFCIGR